MCLQRDGQVGRIHLLDGTPTAAVFEMGRDEPPVLHWIGLTGVGDGEWQWLDLAASPVPTSGCPAAGSGGEKGKPPAAQQGAWVVADGAGAEFGCNAPPLIVDVKQTRGCRR
jgi:hypothetical protein